MTLYVDDILHRSPPKTILWDASVAKLNRFLTEHEISGAPVVDYSDRVVGVVSQTDIVRLISRDVSPDMSFYNCPFNDLGQCAEISGDICDRPVRDIMERRVHSVTPRHDLSIAARMMRNLHIHRLIVLEANRPIGILSGLDLLKVLESPELLARYYPLASSS